ncbi:oligosaccharyltransferase complex subunit epsilon [Ceratobasidium sp. 394]|nr:oligosaccharyltransferase complex subunit epsilon [Ceratobasidium sp. 394]
MPPKKIPVTQTGVVSTTSAFHQLWKSYQNDTPDRLKLIDAFLVFIMVSGIVQFLHCVLVSNFPFNAFLAGFGSTIGQFVLTASLRSQVNPENRTHFKDVSPERYALSLYRHITMLELAP